MRPLGPLTSEGFLLGLRQTSLMQAHLAISRQAHLRGLVSRELTLLQPRSQRETEGERAEMDRIRLSGKRFRRTSVANLKIWNVDVNPPQRFSTLNGYHPPMTSWSRWVLGGKKTVTEGGITSCSFEERKLCGLEPRERRAYEGFGQATRTKLGIFRTRALLRPGRL